MSKGKDEKACDEFVSVEALYKKFPNDRDWIDSVKYKRNKDESEEAKKDESKDEDAYNFKTEAVGKGTVEHGWTGDVLLTLLNDLLRYK